MSPRCASFSGFTQARGQIAGDTSRGLGATGECHARASGMRDEQSANVAAARQKLQCFARYARFIEEADRFKGDKRRLLGGLGGDAVARDKRRRDLTDKYR